MRISREGLQSVGEHRGRGQSTPDWPISTSLPDHKPEPIRLKVGNGQYVMGGTKQAAVALQFVNHRELSRTDLCKAILLKGNFYEAQRY